MDSASDPKTSTHMQPRTPRKSVSWFRRIADIVLVLAIIGFVAFNWVQIRHFFDNFVETVQPCQHPITYSIGTFDTRFGLTEDEFKQAITEATNIWAQPFNRPLFKYEDKGGDVTVNLIFDERQESTDNLSQIGSTIDDNKAEYNTLKSQYDSVLAKYNSDKASLETIVQNYQTEKDAYDKEVAYWNDQGGAPSDEYDKLNQEKDELSSQADAINVAENQVNAEVPTVNQTADDLNTLIAKLNLNVTKYNTVSGSIGSEFDEGEYVTKGNTRTINIYQFTNQTKLERVLAHEFGHALGLGHVNTNPKAIMYYENVGTNQSLTSDDIAALKTLCRVK